MIKIVARIALQLISRFWAFSSAAVLSIVLFYWLCGGLFAFCLMIFACTGLLYHAGDKLLYHPDQVWSLTLFYSVDFSRSRIGVKSAFSANAQPRFASVVVDGALGPPRLAWHT